MTKPIQEMRSHELASQLQAERLEQLLSEKQTELERARLEQDQVKVNALLQVCGDLVTQIEMLDPEIDIQLKDQMLRAYVKRLNENLHTRES